MTEITSETMPDFMPNVYLGSVAFVLWTTHGLPFELFCDMCLERNVVRPSKIVFDALMLWHGDRSRGALSQSAKAARS